MKLYDNPFSPFARKVRIAMDLKGLEVEVVDGLDVRNREALEAVNGRLEVPALVDGAAGNIVVVGSSDIVAYLERTHPQPALYPADPAEFVRARAWERCSDSYIDPILTDISLWTWAERPDAMPEGMLEQARGDLERVYDALNHELVDRDFLCGTLSVAEAALFPHLTATRGFGVSFDAERHPNVLAWFKRLRAMEPFAADVLRAKTFVAQVVRDRGANIERTKIFWRGDRIEWLMARGHHDWFLNEIEQDRVIWPGPAIPRPHPPMG